MDNSIIDLVNTGVLMGIVHVLTGPDHLSALATLSGSDLGDANANANGGRGRSRLGGFFLGVRWGLGHSLGIVLVGGTLIWADQRSEDWIGVDGTVATALESFVGLFMVALGSYGLLKAFRNRARAMAEVAAGKAGGGGGGGGDDEEEQSLQMSEMTHPSLREVPDDLRGRGADDMVAEMADVLNRDGDSMRGGGGGDVLDVDDDDDVSTRIDNAVDSLWRNAKGYGDDDDDDDGMDDEQFLSSLTTPSPASSFTEKAMMSRSFTRIMNRDRSSPMKASSLVHRMAAPENSMAATAGTASRLGPLAGLASRCAGRVSSCPPGAIAVAAGVIHGAAGPGGVLGVVPAVQLRDARLAAVYLGAFCATSIVVMGGFAAFYGGFGEWLAGGGRGRRRANRVFLVECGSAFLSVAVGVLWLVLLSMGKLEDVFDR